VDSTLIEQKLGALLHSPAPQVMEFLVGTVHDVCHDQKYDDERNYFAEI